MLKVVADYFEQLFTTSKVANDEHIFGLVQRKVIDVMNDLLLAHFREDEIAKAVNSMSPFHASGIDDFNALFSQKFWPIIRLEVTDYCLLVLNGTIEIVEINKTYIVLIPKVKRLKNMTRFRPISLCSVLYKIISKVIVNRMLNVCIDEAQGAFIPGRLIFYNTLIAYKILHLLKMKK